jgi:putative transposase
MTSTSANSLQEYVRSLTFDQHYELGKNRHFAALCAQAAQQTCGAVGESVKSFSELIKMFWNGELKDKPKFPKYRKPGMHLVAFPKQALKLVNGMVRLPLGLQTKAWFSVSEFFIGGEIGRAKSGRTEQKKIK